MSYTPSLTVYSYQFLITFLFYVFTVLLHYCITFLFYVFTVLLYILCIWVMLPELKE